MWCSGPLCPLWLESLSGGLASPKRCFFRTEHTTDPQQDLPGVLAGLTGGRDGGLSGQLAALPLGRGSWVCAFCLLPRCQCPGKQEGRWAWFPSLADWGVSMEPAPGCHTVMTTGITTYGDNSHMTVSSFRSRAEASPLSPLSSGQRSLLACSLAHSSAVLKAFCSTETL